MNIDNIKVEKSAVVVIVICGLCMYTFTMAIINRTEWNMFLSFMTALPIILLPYLHGRLKERRRQFDEDMSIGLRQFEERLKGK